MEKSSFKFACLCFGIYAFFQLTLEKYKIFSEKKVWKPYRFFQFYFVIAMYKSHVCSYKHTYIMILIVKKTQVSDFLSQVKIAPHESTQDPTIRTLIPTPSSTLLRFLLLCFAFIYTRFICAPWRTIPWSLCQCLFYITMIKINYQYDTNTFVRF
jgi:hypothetical protein